MALVLPILLLLLAIVADTARAFDAMIVLSNAVREGARYASLEPSPTVGQIKQIVVDDVLGSGTNVTHMKDFSPDDVELEVSLGVAVTVTASYDFPLWFGRLVGAPTVELNRSAVMRHTETSP